MNWSAVVASSLGLFFHTPGQQWTERDKIKKRFEDERKRRICCYVFPGLGVQERTSQQRGDMCVLLQKF